MSERKSEVITAVIDGVTYEKTVWFGQRYLVVEKRKEWRNPVVTAYHNLDGAVGQVRRARAGGIDYADWGVAHVKA